MVLFSTFCFQIVSSGRTVFSNICKLLFYYSTWMQGLFVSSIARCYYKK